MASTFPPSREADLVTFTSSFDTKITATPTAFGLTAAQATTYHTNSAAFLASYAVAQNPLTRSPANIATKSASKTVLLANLRQLAAIVQNFPGMTNPTRIMLGLPTRNPIPSPVPAPSIAPLVEVQSVSGRTARLRLIDITNPTRRGKPSGASGASVFSFVGAAAPADITAWTFEGNTGRTSIDITLPSTVAAGATVWFTAYWFNPRKQNGPACAPRFGESAGRIGFDGGLSMNDESTGENDE